MHNCDHTYLVWTMVEILPVQLSYQEALMKFIQKILIIFSIITSVACRDWKTYHRAKFQAWKSAFNKNYESPEAEQQAMDKMLNNDDEIEAHNNRFRTGKETFKRGLWKRSDLSLEEKKKLLTGSKEIPTTSQTLQAAPKKNNLKNPPPSLNLTALGLVHKVDDQMMCGA